MTLSEALTEFLFDKSIQGLSKKTLESYKDYVTAFINFLGPKKQPEDITQDEIKQYIAALYVRPRPLSKATIATYIRNIKVFLSWLSEDRNVNYKLSKIHLPKVYKKNVHMYEPDEIRLIFSLISAEKEWIVNRNKACIALMLDSGLRQSEVCGIRTADYVITQHRLTVCGKGEKYRIVPVGQLSAQFIEAYLQSCPFPRSDFLFLDRRGGQMTANALKLLVSKIAKQVPFEFSCHKLRHNFATNYCIDMYEHRGHMDSYSLQILMGHSNVETTMRYIHHAMEIVASRARISHLDMLFEADRKKD